MTVGVPTLYEKKFENGPAGVWAEKSAQLKASPIFGLTQRLFPNYGDGGSPPVWTIDLNLGGAFNLGVYVIDIDPRVWMAIKAITLICALALARKLVFGG
ncbi:hypothetical protein DCO45_09710 [Comamonas sp. JNW]|nr:hypothetical protein DCO45_09710 [Comamonas sp. JNW]